MSTTTTSTVAPLPEVANLHETRKAQAEAKKQHPAGTKAPAKAEPKKATEAKAEPKPFTATGRGGKVNVRKFTTEMKFAVDVADPDAKTEAGRKGLIWSFHPSKEAAEKARERYAEKGLDAVITEAKPAE